MPKVGLAIIAAARIRNTPIVKIPCRRCGTESYLEYCEDCTRFNIYSRPEVIEAFHKLGMMG